MSPTENWHYTELASAPDNQIMAHLRAGHCDALAVLYDRYSRLVLSIALRILRDSGEAEDLMQSVFLEILRSAALFDESKGSVKTWILQYAYHRSFNRIQYLTLRGMRKHYESEEGNLSRFNKTIHCDRVAERFDSARAVTQALQYLSKDQTKVIEMVIYDGLTMREVAEATGDSFASVRHHYYRGIEKLRSILRAPSLAKERERSKADTCLITSTSKS